MTRMRARLGLGSLLMLLLVGGCVYSLGPGRGYSADYGYGDGYGVGYGWGYGYTDYGLVRGGYYLSRPGIPLLVWVTPDCVGSGCVPFTPPPDSDQPNDDDTPPPQRPRPRIDPVDDHVPAGGPARRSTSAWQRSPGAAPAVSDRSTRGSLATPRRPAAAARPSAASRPAPVASPQRSLPRPAPAADSAWRRGPAPVHPR